MHTHGAKWDATPQHAKEKYETYAEELREESREKLAEKRTTILDSMEQCRGQIQAAAPSGNQPFRMSACKFTQEQRERFDSLWACDMFT